jgi:hypothetical protein
MFSSIVSGPLPAAGDWLRTFRPILTGIRFCCHGGDCRHSLCYHPISRWSPGQRPSGNRHQRGCRHAGAARLVAPTEGAVSIAGKLQARRLRE